METTEIAFIGAGNMATSLIGGLITDNYPPQKIWASNIREEKLEILASNYHINTTTDNKEAANQAKIVVLCVKPQVLAEVSQELADIVQLRQSLVISISAGVPTDVLSKWLGNNVPIVRCMPNTPALVGAAATGLYANKLVDRQQKDIAEHLLRAVGITEWLDTEEQMDVITALSGSGPAYFFLMIETLQREAEGLGLSPDVAKLFSIQTALGAAKLLLESGTDVEILRERVTSPGGTTEAAINLLERDNFCNIVANAMKAADERAREIAELFRGN